MRHGVTPRTGSERFEGEREIVLLLACPPPPAGTPARPCRPGEWCCQERHAGPARARAPPSPAFLPAHLVVSSPPTLREIGNDSASYSLADAPPHYTFSPHPPSCPLTRTRPTQRPQPHRGPPQPSSAVPFLVPMQPPRARLACFMVVSCHGVTDSLVGFLHKEKPVHVRNLFQRI